MSSRELQALLLDSLAQWQRIENATIVLTGGALEVTRHPVLRILMEIIQQDCRLHHRTQQLLVDSLQADVLALESADVAEIREALRQHQDLERASVRLAQQCHDAVAGQGLDVQELLLTYLQLEETKHEQLLARLAELT